MDILASDWSNSSNWSGSQQHEEEQDIVPFLAPDNNPSSDVNKAKAAFCPAQSRSTSSSNQTAVMITDESAMTGTSSFGQGSGSRHALAAISRTPTTAELPLTEQRVASAQAQLTLADTLNIRHHDAASDFSRSGSSNWSNDEAQPAAAAGPTRFHLAQLIGRGAFGSVYKGSWKGRPAAIKASFAA